MEEQPVTWMILHLIVLAAASAAFLTPPAEGQDARSVSVLSPGGRNLLMVECPESGSGRPMTFSVARDGRQVIEPSALMVSLAGKGGLAAGARVIEVKEGRFDGTFDLPWGKCRRVRNHGSRARLRLESGGVLWDLELRASDDGVAYRYSLPEQPELRDFALKDEATEYRLAGNPTVLFMTLPGFITPHESVYRQKPLAEVPKNELIDMPLLAVWPDGTSAALTEARLRDFAGMYLEREEEGNPPVLRCRLAPSRSGENPCVIGHTPHSSPWRVVLLADRAGMHLESNLLLCLNDPPEGDFSWAKPGKSTWHWWNGTREEGLPFRCGMNFETHKYYIDFCARHGITYHAVVADDRPWYTQSGAGFGPCPDTDLLCPRTELELPKLLEYAGRRGVGIRLWVHWLPLSKRMEEVFARYEEWGVRGLMVDFLDRDDQEMVQFCDRLLEAAARHKLHIQFHGSYKPSGEQRTFPHLFNREGVLNLEYLKWSGLCTPGHNVNVAYTRLLAGPTDYHLGGFRSVPPDAFKPRYENPDVLGTRCHHLALYVVYENPMPMVCDAPSAYEGQPGFEFLKEVPTTWDETRFLEGEPGEYIALARRRNAAWYLGGINNETGRTIRYSLDFLGRGEYEACLFVDGSPGGERPNSLRKEKNKVTAGSVLEATMAPGGGFAAVVRPKPEKEE